MAEFTDDNGNHEHLYTGFEKIKFNPNKNYFNKHPDVFIISDPGYQTYKMEPITISGELYIPSYMSNSYKKYKIKNIDPSGVFFADLSNVTDVKEDETIINEIKNGVIKSNNIYTKVSDDKNIDDNTFPFHKRYKKVNSYNPTEIKPNDVNTIGNLILKLIELNEKGIDLELLDGNEYSKIPLFGRYNETKEIYDMIFIYRYLKKNEKYSTHNSLTDLFKIFEEVFPTSNISEENISEEPFKPNEENFPDIIFRFSPNENIEHQEKKFEELKQKNDELKQKTKILKKRIIELLEKNESQPEQQPEQQLPSTPGGENIPFKVSFDSNANIVKVEINNNTFGDGTYIVGPKYPNNKPETSGGEIAHNIDKTYSFVYNTGDKSIKHDKSESTPESLSIEDGNNTFIWDIQSGGEVQVPKSLNNLEGKEIQVIIGSGDGMGMVNNKRDSGKTNVEAYWNALGTNRKNVIQIHCCDKNYDDQYKTSQQENIEYVKENNLQGNIVICYIDVDNREQSEKFLNIVKKVHVLRTDDTRLAGYLTGKLYVIHIEFDQQTLDDLIRKYGHIPNLHKTSLKTAIKTILNKKEPPKPKTTLSVITNNGVPPETGMKNQCFWISIADWYKIKDPGTNNTVPVLRDFAKNLNAGKINDENQLMTISDFTNNNFDLIRAFADAKNLYIRIFYYDPVNRALQLGDCEQEGFDACKGRVFDFGNVTATEYVLIVAYGSHFELITECNQGNFNYNINDNKDQKITDNKKLKESRHYNNNGVIVQWNELNIEEKIGVLRDIDHSLNKFQPKPTPS